MNPIKNLNLFKKETMITLDIRLIVAIFGAVILNMIGVSGFVFACMLLSIFILRPVYYDIIWSKEYLDNADNNDNLNEDNDNQ